MLEEMGLDVLQIHSRRTAAERTAASETFRESTQQVLLSSDVSARGVDYPDVSLVLQVWSAANPNPNMNPNPDPDPDPTLPTDH